MVAEVIKIKVGGSFEGVMKAIVPEGFFDKFSDTQKFEWANKYVREMKVQRLMEELKLDRVDAVKVLDVMDIFDRPLVEYIQKGEKGEEMFSRDGQDTGHSPS